MELTDLKSLRSDVLTYQHIFDRVDALRDNLERITTQYGTDPRGGGSGDKMSDMVAQIVDILNSLSARLIAIEKKRYAAELAIRELPAQQASVMYLRYIEGMSGREIACHLVYSEQHIFRELAAAEKKIIALSE